MSEAVSIKGMKSGIVLVLNPDIPFQELKDMIAAKFEEAAPFLGNAKMGLAIKGRHLSSNETEEVAGIISDHSKIKIVCFLEDDNHIEAMFDGYFKRMENESSDDPDEDQKKSVHKNYNSFSKAEAEKEKSESFIQGNSVIYRGNIRSGQQYSSDKSIVILGDVNPGGSVISAGCVFILGSLMGNVYAGSTGDKRSYIMAWDFHPLQVRIADCFAVSPDSEGGRSGKFLERVNKNSKNFQNTQTGPEVAYIISGQIARSVFDEKFIRNSSFF